MRAIVTLLFLSIAANCFAEDPLETLNTVEDAVATMEQTLKTQGGDRKDAAAAPGGPSAEVVVSQHILYFVSGEKIGSSDWVTANPCPEGVVPDGKDAAICLPQAGGSESAPLYWKSRLAVPSELKPGMVVLTQDEARDGAWIMAKVTDLSEVETGYVGISAPFKAHVQGLRLVLE